MAAANKNAVDQYIAAFPEETRQVLQQVRYTLLNAAPGAEETIAYGIPTLTLKGNLVHFAGYKSHVGFYPAPSGIKAFAKELSVYKHAKGSVQFPLDKPMPLALIKRIVKYRVKENLSKAAEKPMPKKK